MFYERFWNCPKKSVSERFFRVFSFFLLALLPSAVSADFSITEIMYDLANPNSDTGREWIEIKNEGASALDANDWKFFENNTSHLLTLVKGIAVIPAGGFAVIVNDSTKFLVDWPSFSGTIFDSSFSLSNTSELIALKLGDRLVSEVSYNSGMGGSEDGNSIYRSKDGSWKGDAPTPGVNDPSFVTTDSVETNNSNSQTSNNSSKPTTTENSSTSSGSGSPLGASAPEPKIFAKIKASAEAVSGADTVFSGEARAKDGTIVSRARFIWSFGDGGSAEGESVFHTFVQPGKYVVVLDAVSETWNSSDRLTVLVSPAEVYITAVAFGAKGGITLTNKSDKELVLSWWRLEAGGKFFTLPKNTIILPKGDIFLADSVTGLGVGSGAVKLFYPNGELLRTFESIAEGDGAKPLAVKETTKKESLVVIESSTLQNGEKKTIVSSKPASKLISETKGETVSASIGSAPVAVSSGDFLELSDTPIRQVSSVWLLSLGGVLLLGVFGVLFASKKEAVERSAEKDETDSFEIIED